jgi:hypothetical protein
VSTLVQAQRDLDAAQRAAVAVGKLVDEARRAHEKATTTLSKARADHASAEQVHAQRAASFAENPSDGAESDLEKADRRVRLARVTLDAAESKYRATESGQQEAEAAKRKADADASRLAFELEVNAEGHQRAVDLEMRAICEHVQAALESIRTIAARRKAMAETARAHATAGHGTLALPLAEHDYLAVLEAVASKGINPHQHLLRAIVDGAARDAEGKTLLDREADLLVVIARLFSETNKTASASPNRGIETSTNIAAAAATMRATGQRFGMSHPDAVKASAPVSRCGACGAPDGEHVAGCNAPRASAAYQIPRTW